MKSLEEKIRQVNFRAVPDDLEAMIFCPATKRKSFRIHDCLWPSPYAWASLAAIWLLGFAVNLTTRDASPTMAKSPVNYRNSLTINQLAAHQLDLYDYE